MTTTTTIINEAHKLMMRRMIEETSIEAVLDLISDYAMVKAGLCTKRPTVSQKRYRELGAALAYVIAIAVKKRI